MDTSGSKPSKGTPTPSVPGRETLSQEKSVGTSRHLESFDFSEYKLPPLHKADEYDKTIFALTYLELRDQRKLAKRFGISSKTVSAWLGDYSVAVIYERQKARIVSSLGISLADVIAELWEVQKEARGKGRMTSAVEALKTIADILRPAGEQITQTKGGVTLVFNGVPNEKRVVDADMA